MAGYFTKSIIRKVIVEKALNLESEDLSSDPDISRITRFKNKNRTPLDNNVLYTLSFIKRLNLLLNIFSTIKKEKRIKEFPGSSVVRSLNFHCQGPRFNPCGELRSHKLCDRFKKLTKKKKKQPQELKNPQDNQLNLNYF